MEVSEIVKKIGDYTGLTPFAGDDEKLVVKSIPFLIPQLDRIIGDGIPRGRMTEIIGEFSTGKCVSGDTCIFTDKGIFRIEELAEELGCGEQRNGYRVFDGFGDLRNASIYYDGERETVGIETKLGYTIRGTEVHPLLCINSDGGLEFKKISDIECGDYVAINGSQKTSTEYVCIPKYEYLGRERIRNRRGILVEYDRHPHNLKIPRIVPDVVDEEVARYLGYLIGDGHGLCLTNSDYDIVGDFQKIMYHMWEEQPRIYYYDGVTVECVMEVRFSGKWFEGWLDNIGYNCRWTAGIKEVPWCIFKSPKTVIANFIRAYFDCDAEFSKGHGIVVYSKSQKLVRQVHILLASIGIISACGVYDDGGVICIHSDMLHKYLEVVGSTCERKRKILEGRIRGRDHIRASTTKIPYQKKNVRSLIKKIYELNGATVGEKWVNTKKKRIVLPDGNVGVYPENWNRNVICSQDHSSRYNLSLLLRHLEYYKYLPEYKRIHNIISGDLFFDAVSSKRIHGKEKVYDFCIPTTNCFASNGIVSHNTTITQFLIRSAQEMGLSVVYFNAENKYDPRWFAATGVDTKNIVVVQGNLGEVVFDAVGSLIKSEVGLIIVDSIAALMPVAEYEESLQQKFMGDQAKMMSEGLRHIMQDLSTSSTSLVFINQMRSTIGQYHAGDSPPGGKAQFFYASVILSVRRGEWIEDKQGDKSLRKGFHIMARTTKNTLAPPFQEADIPFYFTGKFDMMWSLVNLALDLGIVQKAGAWYSFGDSKAQGIDRFIDHLRENKDVARELASLVAGAK